MLLPVPQTSFRDIIRKPIEVAARRGQQITISPALVDELVGEATGADALPLLAFTLSFLYQSFAPGGTITPEQYKAIGGMAGSIDKAVKQALARPGDEPAIPAAPAEQLSCLRATSSQRSPPWIWTALSQSGVSPNATNSSAPRARWSIVWSRRGSWSSTGKAAPTPSRWRTKACCGNGRLWPSGCTRNSRSSPSSRRRARRRGMGPQWSASGLARSPRRPAECGRSRAAKEDFRRRLGARHGLSRSLPARETRQRRIMQAVGWGVAAVTAAFMVVFFILWQNTLQAKESEASLLVAKSELDRGSGNVAAARAEAAQAYRSMPNVQTRSALLQAAMEISPHKHSCSRSAAPSPRHWPGGAAIVLDFDRYRHWRLFGRLETSNSTPLKPAGSFARPLLTRSQEGNPAHIRALAPLAMNG